MVYKHFRTNIVLRILLILSLGYAILYVATQTHFWLVAFWIALLVVILTLELISYVERSHKNLNNFLLSIRQSDFSTVYPTLPHKGSQESLKQAYHQILKVFQQLRSEKEFHHQYLQTVVEHVKVALICYDEAEEVQLMNQTAKQLLGKPYIKNLKALAQIDSTLLESIRRLQPGNKELVSLQVNGSAQNLSMQATSFKLKQKPYKLVSFQDIRSELETQEVESWQKLIRVLTHEIMNSVIPIATLTSVINEMLQDSKESHEKQHNLAHLDEEDVMDIRTSLQTVESRSRGLISFIKAYSSLTQTVKPVYREVRVEELFTRVYTLLRPDIEKKQIQFTSVILQENLCMMADQELMEQVLINLVLNAIDAVEGKEHAAIELIARIDENKRALLQIKDNGTGMDEETLQHIFVPFFTTKKKGSGIGLSLSKQIVLLHKGNITIDSQVGKGSTCSVYL